MAVFHYFGVFLLLAGWVLLLVASITSPVVNSLALAKVQLTNSSTITFGAFGYCVRHAAAGNDASVSENSNQDWCTGSHIGYQVANEVTNADMGTHYNVVAHSTTNGLTNAFILHPIGAGVAFIAFIVAIIPTWVTALLGALTAVVAFIISLVVMAIDFAVFGVIKNNANRDGSGSHATYSTAIWLVLAATIALFFGAIIVFLSCCSTRNKRRTSKSTYDTAPPATTGTGRRRWFNRRRY